MRVYLGGPIFVAAEFATTSGWPGSSVPPRSGVDNQAYYLNPFIVGGMRSSLGIVYNEADLIKELMHIAVEHGL